MICPNCGNVNEKGKFCTKCGAKLIDSEVASTSQFADVNQNLGQNAPNTSSIHTSNDYVEKGKIVSKQYFHHMLEALKNPTNYNKKLSADHMVNGIITIVLLSIFLSLFIFISVDKAFSFYNDSMNEIFGGFMESTNLISASFSDHFLQPFLILLIYFTAIVATIFGVLKVNNGTVSFQEVIARFGAFLVVPMVLEALIVLLAFINVSFTFMSILSLFTMFSIFISFAFTIYSYKGTGNDRLDPLYGTLIVFAVSVLLNYLFWDSLLSSLMKGFGF